MGRARGVGATCVMEKVPGCCIRGTEAGLTPPPPPPPETNWPAVLPGEPGSVEQQLVGSPPPPPPLIPVESIGDSTDIGEAGNCR